MTARMDGFRQMEATDQARRIMAMIREGTVKEVRADGMVRVETGDLTTDWLPQAGLRAGDDAMWWPLDEGEQVVVLCPSGDTRNGIVFSSDGSEQKPRPAGSLDQLVITFRDGTRIVYDRAESVLTVDAAGKITVRATGAVDVESEALISMKAPDIKIEGNVDFSGGHLKHNGVNVGATHKHGGVQPGPGVSNVAQ